MYKQILIRVVPTSIPIISPVSPSPSDSEVTILKLEPRFVDAESVFVSIKYDPFHFHEFLENFQSSVKWSDKMSKYIQYSTLSH